MDSDRVGSRRAIEALRNGVPSKHAVTAVGANQGEIERAFRSALDRSEQQQGAGQVPGLLIGGGFGTGKSHALDYLKQIALAKGFVCSKVVISKETPLHKPDNVFASAVGSAAVPGSEAGPAIDAIWEALDGASRSPSTSYSEFSTWIKSTDCPLGQMFAASVHLFEELKRDAQVAEDVRAFWAGQLRLSVTDIRRHLRSIAAASAFNVKAIKAGDLALQRFTFMSRLIRGAGFKGWVLLLDEVELISRFSIKQRGLSYAELARLFGRLKGQEVPGLVTVGAISDDFYKAVILGEGVRGDKDDIPARLDAIDPTGASTARATTGIQIIGEAIALRRPDETVRHMVYEKLKALHRAAYNWEPPEVNSPPESHVNAMRLYVRWWINSWDLRRLNPETTPRLVIQPIHETLNEDRDMDPSSEDEDRPETADTAVQ